MEEHELIDRNGVLTLPDTGEGIDALARQFLPGRRSPVPLAKRLRILTRILLIARNNSYSLRAALEKARSADERVAAAKREADERVAEARRERDAVRTRFGVLERHDLTIMVLIAQLTRAAGCVPGDLKLDHPEEGPGVASGTFGDQPVVIDGTGHISVDGGKLELQASTYGASLAEGNALAAYFEAVQMLGTGDVRELARQFAELMQAGAIEGLMASTGCGNCGACAELTDRVRKATTREETVAALIWKVRHPCPAGATTSADPVSIGIKVVRQ